MAAKTASRSSRKCSSISYCAQACATDDPSDHPFPKSTIVTWPAGPAPLRLGKCLGICRHQCSSAQLCLSVLVHDSLSPLMIQIEAILASQMPLGFSCSFWPAPLECTHLFPLQREGFSRVASSNGLGGPFGTRPCTPHSAECVFWYM